MWACSCRFGVVRATPQCSLPSLSGPERLGSCYKHPAGFSGPHRAATIQRSHEQDGWCWTTWGQEAAVREARSEHGGEGLAKPSAAGVPRGILSERSVLAMLARMEKTRCSLIRLQRIPPDGKTLFWKRFLKMAPRAEGFAPRIGEVAGAEVLG